MTLAALPARIREKIAIDVEMGCWQWTACLDTGGYAKLAVAPRGSWDRGHRVVYRLVVGPIPDDLTLDHLCRNRACVNPAHLEPVTMAENILRGEGTGARFARRTHCDNGHEFTAENTYRRTDGGRRCRTCRRDVERRAA